MKTKHFYLKDICKFINGGTPSKKKPIYYTGRIPWITSADIVSNEVTNARNFITQEAINNSTTKLIKKGTVLLVTRTGVGKVALAGMDLCFSQDITGIIPDEMKLDNKYLAYFLRTKIDYFNYLQRGATIQGITREVIENLEIPLLPLPEQKRIAAILDKADSVRRKRQETIRLLDEFLRSVFLEMFGDPVKNEKGFVITELENLCTEIVDCPHSTPIKEDKATNYACIRTTELQNGYIFWDSMQYVSESEYKKRISRLKPLEGDIVYGREGSFGEAIIIPSKPMFCLGQRTMLFRPNYNKCNSIFLWAMVRSNYVYTQALKKNNGSTVGHINVKDIKKFKVLQPPMEIQNKFAQIVKKIEQQKSLFEKSFLEMENCFKSLMQKAFLGEL